MLVSWIAWLSTYRNVPKKPAGYLRGSSKDKTSARNLQKVQNVQYDCSAWILLPPFKKKKAVRRSFLLSLHLILKNSQVRKKGALSKCVNREASTPEEDEYIFV